MPPCRLNRTGSPPLSPTLYMWRSSGRGVLATKKMARASAETWKRLTAPSPCVIRRGRAPGSGRR